MNIESNANLTDIYLFNNKNSSEFNQKLTLSRNMNVKNYDYLNNMADYTKRFLAIMSGCNILIRQEDRFVYFLDMDYLFDNNRGVVFDNISVDYRRIVEKGLYELKYSDEECSNKFCRDYNVTIDGLIILAKRIAEYLGDDRRASWFKNMTIGRAKSFEEALQRVLFLNQVLWQTNHPLMGFGLLDTILSEIYEKDKKDHKIDRKTATDIIVDFYKVLHRYFWYKSHALLGDTGQLVIVGRTGNDGRYIYNDLTYAFIDGIRIAQVPDPKVMLRVSRNMPDDLLDCAIDCVATGVGCPLFANDDVIIPILIKNGIQKEDAYLYATSACWEPLISWKCPISNNLTVLNYLRSLENLLLRDPIKDIKDFEGFLSRYFFYLERNINAAKNSLSKRRFAYDPLVSIFIGGCYENKKDVSHGGAVYNDYGMTTVGISNTVNALINIKKYVFDEKLCTIDFVRKVMINDFEDETRWKEILKKTPEHYGMTNELVINLTNKIVKKTIEYTKDYINYMGGKVKFGLSSPAYIDAARNTMASFDGRGCGDPFHVHISNTDSEAYSELVNFATSIDFCDNSYNGNVIDFVVTPLFISENKDKFMDFLKASVYKGFFEMQIGVLSSKQLIEAKNNPDAFPNIIVRVWGFSTYFKDLPEEYKNVIIKRALDNEKKLA